MKKNSFLLLILLPFLFIGGASSRSRKSLGQNIINHDKSSQNTSYQYVPTIQPNNSYKPVEIKEALSEIKDKPMEFEDEKALVPNSEEEIYLNFENAELINFINFVAEYKKVNIIPDKGIAGNKISLDIRKPVSIEQAWRILHTITEMSGFTIVKIGDVYKITPKNNKMTEPLPVYINVPLETLPNSDESIRYVAFLSNVKAAEVKPLLDSMLQNQSLLQDSVNGLILVDRSFNIKSAMKVIYELDKTGLQESVIVIKLKEANATEVRDLLKSLMADKNQNVHPLARLLGKVGNESPSQYFSPNTKIIAEKRTNSLILLGTKQATEKIQRFVVEKVDQQLKALDSPLHVYELQYADAKQMVEILKEVTTQPESLAGQQASKHGAVRSGTKYFKPMSFKADVEGNRIIVSTTDAQDWELISETIKNLDKPQPLVAVECLIVSVDVTDEKSLGGQTRNKNSSMLGKNLNIQSVPLSKTILKADGEGNKQSLLGNLIEGVTGGLGKTLLTFGRESNIWSIFEMLQKQVHTSVVAQPFLTVANQYKASVIIGQTKRVASGSVFTSAGDTISGEKDAIANVELHIAPQINIDGIISLKILVKNDEFKESATNRERRLFDTTVSVANGQVIALSGFVKTKVTEGVSKTPILGDIPLFGWFFKNKSKTFIKQNVLVFISPTIIKPRQRQGINLYTKQKLEMANKAIESSNLAVAAKDPIHSWFFDAKHQSYSHKIDDFAAARYQPVTVDIQNDPYYRTNKQREESLKEISSSQKVKVATKDKVKG